MDEPTRKERPTAKERERSRVGWMVGLNVGLGVVALALFAVLFVGVAAVCSGVVSSSDALKAKVRP